MKRFLTVAAAAALALVALGGAGTPVDAATAFPTQGQPLVCSLRVHMDDWYTTPLTGNGTCTDGLGLRTFPATVSAPANGVPHPPTCPYTPLVDLRLHGAGGASARYALRLDVVPVLAGPPSVVLGLVSGTGGSGGVAVALGARCGGAAPAPYDASVVFVGLAPAPT